MNYNLKPCFSKAIYMDIFQIYSSSKLMLIKDVENFNINKLLLLFNIAWLLQLKKIPNNQLKMNENVLTEENKTGLVSNDLADLIKT